MVVLLRRFHPGRSVLCSLLAIAICYFAALCVLEKRGFWITDNANKFLQVQALANSRYTDFSIPWPGQIVDPDFALQSPSLLLHARRVRQTLFRFLSGLCPYLRPVL